MFYLFFYLRVYRNFCVHILLKCTLCQHFIYPMIFCFRFVLPFNELFFGPIFSFCLLFQIDLVIPPTLITNSPPETNNMFHSIAHFAKMIRVLSKSIHINTANFYVCTHFNLFRSRFCCCCLQFCQCNQVMFAKITATFFEMAREDSNFDGGFDEIIIFIPHSIKIHWISSQIFRCRGGSKWRKHGQEITFRQSYILNANVPKQSECSSLHNQIHLRKFEELVSYVGYLLFIFSSFWYFWFLIKGKGSFD